MPVPAAANSSAATRETQRVNPRKSRFFAGYCGLVVGLPYSRRMAFRHSIGRRALFSLGVPAAAAFAVSRRSHPATVLHFATADCEIQMSIEFYDRYSARGLRFYESLRQDRFCLSREGQSNRNCLPDFSGALAVANYVLRKSRSGLDAPSLRELVRTIDSDISVPVRPPFERTIPLQNGVASDIQAFGLEKANPPPLHDPWCILRQDLYLAGCSQPFLIVHWRHSLDAIRLVDVIPGERTRQL